MSFRLTTIFYVFALLAATLATFGVGLGIYLFTIVLFVRSYVIVMRGSHLAASIIVGIVLLLHLFLLTAINDARNAAHRSSDLGRSYWNMTAITGAILRYEAANGTLPPAFIADAEGRPMHSWRVLILPYLGEPTLTALYSQYAFDEPWDGPRNRQLWDRIPDCFQTPIGGLPPSCTGYLAVVGDDTAWPGATAVPTNQISDDPRGTILLIEATCRDIKWTEPRDLSKQEAIELLTTRPLSGHGYRRDGFLSYTLGPSRNLLSFISGRVNSEAQLRDPDLANAMLTNNGGETLPDSFDETHYRRIDERTFVKWSKVWGSSVFLVLSLMPATWIRPMKRAENPAPPEQPEGGEPQKIVVAAGQ